ncbi:MAG: YfbK domain-containing protein [Luteolibacter sp.]
MNEKPPPPFDTVGDESVEARIVAWVLGEASAFEATELERLCEERPELLVFRRRMRTLHGLLTEAEAAENDHSWKLPEEKRKVLDEIFGEEKVTRLEPHLVRPGGHQEQGIRRSGRRALLAIAACLILTIIVAQLIGPISRISPIKSAVATDTAVAPSEQALQELNKAVRDQEDEVEERRKVLSTIVGTKSVSYKPQSGVGNEVMEADSRQITTERGLDNHDYSDAKRDFEAELELLRTLKLKQIAATRAADESFAANQSAKTAPSDGSYRLESKSISSNRELGMLRTKEQSMLAKSPAQPAAPVAASATPDLTQLPSPAESRVMDPLPAIAASGLGGGEGMGSGMALDEAIDLGGNDNTKTSDERALAIAPDDSAVRRRIIPSKATIAGHDLASDNQSRAELFSQVDATWELLVPEDGKKREFLYPTEFEPPATASETPAAEEAESLANLANEILAAETPYSTFSLNISDASFQLAKATLTKGERPDPASIKPEQFYNAVDYGDPAPASNEPVAATIEQSAHPVIPGRNLVRVALRTGSVGRGAVQPLRLTLLVDQSGSMLREDRRASMEHALDQLGVLLTKNDLVTVIGFSRTPHLLAEGKAADETLKLPELINQTASEGGTNLEEALKLGGQLAERYQLAGAQNRIVLFTDGAANLGDANPAHLAEQVKAFRQKGLAFDIAGIGADGLNDRLLSELARNGNGRYYVVGDEKNDSLARQLAGAFRPSAENVKVQVNFNPQRVGNYKLIGFEKDRLKTEDFRNDAVDAAELAAEEAGVAVYQVEPLADGTGEIGEVSVRFRDAASQEMVERNWTIPFESQATVFDRATPSMQLAGLSLLAAEKLKGGPLADAIDFKQLSGSSTFVKQFYAGSSRVSDMLRVIDALK